MPPTPRSPRSPLAASLLVVTSTVILSVVLSLVGFPSAVLFASLLGGMAHALTSATRLAVPLIAFRVGQGLLGVTIGSLVSFSSLVSLGSTLLPILVVTIGTIGVSLLAGRVLGLRSDVSPITGAFAMIAGGASAVVASAHDLGADDRVVAVVQYLRVLVVLATMPVVTALVFQPQRASVLTAYGHDGSLAAQVGFVGASLVVGLGVARMLPIATMALLAPLAVAVALGAVGWFGQVSVPAVLQWLAYALIGAQIGLRFTRESLTSIASMLPAVLGLITVIVAVSAAMGAGLAWATHVDGLTAYLATTPGGLWAVLALAADSGSDVTYVMALQLLRLVLIILLVPVIARYLSRGAR